MPLKFILLIFQFLILIIVNQTKVSAISLKVTVQFLEWIYIRRSTSENSLPLSIIQLGWLRSASPYNFLFGSNFFWVYFLSNRLERYVSQNQCILVSFTLRWPSIAHFACPQQIELYAFKIIYCLFLRVPYFDGSFYWTKFYMDI